MISQAMTSKQLDKMLKIKRSLEVLASDFEADKQELFAIDIRRAVSCLEDALYENNEVHFARAGYGVGLA